MKTKTAAVSLHDTKCLPADSIHLQDCLVGMQLIPDQSIDMILCDLPYEVLHRNNPSVQWDRMLPLDQLWAQYLRIAKPNAAIVLFAQGMFTARLMMSQPDLWKYNLIWEKDRCTGFLNANRMPMRNHEDICVFYRQQPTYHPQMTVADSPIHPRGNGHHKETYRCYGKHGERPDEQVKKVGKTYDYAHINRVAPTADPNLRFPCSVLQYKKEHDRTQSHPTQKPVDLLRYLIRTYTNPGDLVLDNCLGSGSTCVAAIREGRHYLGFETDPEYFRIAQRRIAQEGERIIFPA